MQIYTFHLISANYYSIIIVHGNILGIVPFCQSVGMQGISGEIRRTFLRCQERTNHAPTLPNRIYDVAEPTA